MITESQPWRELKRLAIVSIDFVFSAASVACQVRRVTEIT